MKFNVVMPSLGADMDQGRLLEWHIKPGDTIKKGDLIAAVETQKAAVDIESFHTGTVLELVGQEGETIQVGDVIAILDVAGTTAAPPAPATTAAAPVTAAAPEPAAIPVAPKPVTPPLRTPETSGERVFISPAARQLAAQHGLDIHLVKGSGPEGIISLRDIEAAVAGTIPATPIPPARAAAPASASLINVREAIARAMSRSKREIPHYYLQSQFHLDTLVAWLDAKNRSLPPEQRLFMPAVLMRAVVLALKANPDMNGYYQDNVYQPSSDIHLGVTVAIKPSGVMTPAILDAHTLALAELNAAFTDIVQRTRAGKLRNREMTDGTVTVTNVGDLGADAVTGVIFPPQVALVGFGRVRKAAIVDADGGLRAGFVLDATLAADHRVSDGLAGSKLLNTLGKLFAQPELLEK